jgi:hypothetical protein
MLGRKGRMGWTRWWAGSGIENKINNSKRVGLPGEIGAKMCWATIMNRNAFRISAAVFNERFK